MPNVSQSRNCFLVWPVMSSESGAALRECSADHHGEVVESEVASGVAPHLAGRFLESMRQMQRSMRW